MILSDACRDADHSQCLGYTQVVLGSDSRSYHTADDLYAGDTEPCQCPCHARRWVEDAEGVKFGVMFDSGPVTDDQFEAVRAQIQALAERMRKGEIAPGDKFPIDLPLPKWFREKPASLEQLDLWGEDTAPQIPVPTTADEYQEQAVRTAADQPDVNERLKFGSMGMGAESGEVLNLVYKTAYQGHPWTEVQRRKLVLEVGDVLWFCAYTLAAVDCTMMDAMQANNTKLRKRYGDKFSTAKSLARKDVED